MLDPHQNAPAIASKSFRSRIVWALRRVDFFSIVDPIRGIDERPNYQPSQGEACGWTSRAVTACFAVTVALITLQMCSGASVRCLRIPQLLAPADFS